MTYSCSFRYCSWLNSQIFNFCCGLLFYYYWLGGGRLLRVVGFNWSALWIVKMFCGVSSISNQGERFHHADKRRLVPVEVSLLRTRKGTTVCLSGMVLLTHWSLAFATYAACYSLLPIRAILALHTFCCLKLFAEIAVPIALANYPIIRHRPWFC